MSGDGDTDRSRRVPPMVDPAVDNSGRGEPGPEPPIPPVPPLNPVYDAELTQEEIVLLASLGVRNPGTGEIVSIKAIAGVFARLIQKIREQAVEATHESRDSIELSRNAKGDYAHKIKVYMDAWKNPGAGIELVANINKEMVARYAQTPRVIEK